MRILFFLLALVVLPKPSISQIFECNNYYILEVRDTIINSINPAVLVKMYTDSNTVNNGHYTSLSFVDQHSDTLTKYPHYVYELPIVNTQYDTMEYLLWYENGFTSFPENFDGILLINAPHCEISYNHTTTSVENIEKSPLLFFPNPSSERVIISNKSAINITSIELYNSNGKLLRIESSRFNEVDVSKLDSGIYYIKVYSNNKEIATEKIIKN